MHHPALRMTQPTLHLRTKTISTCHLTTSRLQPPHLTMVPKILLCWKGFRWTFLRIPLMGLMTWDPCRYEVHLIFWLDYTSDRSSKDDRESRVSLSSRSTCVQNSNYSFQRWSHFTRETHPATPHQIWWPATIHRRWSTAAQPWLEPKPIIQW